jgi:putative flippase GtrA
MRLIALLRAILATAGILLLGGALVWAPIAAFRGGDMSIVTEAGIVGIVLALVAKFIPAPRSGTREESEPSPGDAHPPGE